MPRGGLIPEGAAMPAGEAEPDYEGEENEERGGDASEEEQAAYNVFVSNISNLVTDPKALPKIIERLRTGENPVNALAETAVMLVMRVEDSALEKTGADEIDPDILLTAGQETVELLAEVARKANIHDFNEDEMESAYLAATDSYRAQRFSQGRVDPAKYQPSMQALKQSDADGTFDEEFPEVAEYAAHVQNRAKAVGVKTGVKTGSPAAGMAVENKIAPGEMQ